MPGHNHYSDCTCGWCVSTRLVRMDRGPVSLALRQRDARFFLERNAARSASACFIQTNERCPVCGVTVFFYANSFGGRVYFDDLGPPWSKHPCTDNPRRQKGIPGGPGGAPVRRTKGVMQELITAGNTVGMFRGKIPGVRAAGDWTLLVITSIEDRGE